MGKYAFLLIAALVLVAIFAGARAEIPARDASAPVTISPENLHRQVDGRSLPLTFIEEPY
ncbi:MAG: hypothetical protein JO328_11515 [Hyphomicrobiales bacterium]|nr:hypothetical protein [Hyphomicrobiales bacterium]MBV8824613.1 hypothetical protein [Hyphomicrobiales bacterium]